MRYLFLCVMLLGMSSQILLAQTTEHTLAYDGLDRTYLLHVPDSYSGDDPVPLVFVLHGGGGDAAGMVKLTRGGFDMLADEYGFIVVYPNGVGKHWNDGRTGDIGKHSSADDVGFFDALIDELSAAYNIDENQIYATGISNGGMMSYRLACDLSNHFAGIAPVAANLSVDLSVNCTPDEPTDVLMILGTDDPLMPYDGGEITVLGLKRGLVLAADDVLTFWTNAFHCGDDSTEVQYPNKAWLDGTHITELQYDHCDDVARVYLMSVHGGGHTWASGLPYLPRTLIGNTSRDVDANAVIWEFFTADE